MSVGQDWTGPVSALRSLVDETATYFNQRGLDPHPGSRAILELSDFRTECVRAAYGQANLLIEVSADQLNALLRSLTEPFLTIAPWTCARAILESSALAAWLLDPSIGARERAQRSFAFRFEGLSQQLKFLRVAGEDTERVSSRIEHVEAKALSLGFPKVQDQKGRRIGIGQQLPRMVELIACVCGGESAYRLFSAFVHGHEWAIIQLSCRRAQDISSDKGEFARNTVFFKKDLAPESMVFLCQEAAHAFSMPIWYKVQLYGYELPEFRTILNRAFDALRYSNPGRFWDPA